MYQEYLAKIDLIVLGDKIYEIKTIEQIEEQNFL